MATEFERALSRMVQRGIVTAVDPQKLQVRVKFMETDMISGWLKVLQHRGMGLSITEDGGHGHEVTVKDTYTGGGSGTVKTVPDHDHAESATTTWMPKVNDQVVVLYLPVDDGDGFVLGGL